MTDIKEEIEKEELPTSFIEQLKFSMLIGTKYDDEMARLAQKINAGDVGTWTKHLEFLDSKKTSYLREIEASFNQDVETKARITAKYDEIMKQKGLNCAKTAVFYGELMNLVDSADKRLSVTMQYASLLAMADKTKEEFINEIMRKGITEKLKEDEKREINKKVAEVLAMSQKINPEFSLDALKTETEAHTKLIEQTQTKIESLQLEANAQQNYIGVKNVCDTIKRLELELKRPPNNSEIRRGNGIANETTDGYLKIAREKHYVTMSRFGGKQKRYTVVVFPKPAEFESTPAKTPPKPEPNNAVSREKQDTVTVDTQKPVKIAQTEGVMDEEINGEDTNETL